jgi:hypothetical protein
LQIRFELDVIEDIHENDTTTDDVTGTTDGAVTTEVIPNLIEEFDEFMLKWNTHEVYNGSVPNSDAQIAYPDYEGISEDFLQKLWSFDMEIDGVVLENNWPLDTSWKDHEETYQELPYFNEVTVHIIYHSRFIPIQTV